MSVGYRAERLFAQLCSRQFLRGFTFHSPRYYDPNEREAGDIVLWIRRQVIAVEMLAREAEPGTSTEQFVKRIGKKRRQLVSDYEAFCDPNIDIELTNEEEERVAFDTRDLGSTAGIGFTGIIVLDCNDYLEKPHFKTVEKSLKLPFPVAIMKRRDFLDLMAEVDTIPDLTYYLFDRAEFLRKVYSDQAHLFLDLNRRLERNLIAFYKLHGNRFPVNEWDPTDALHYYDFYHATFRDRIAARNSENTRSRIVDDLDDAIRSGNEPHDSTLLHSWELATLTRRQRASPLSEKIVDAIDRMRAGNPSRHFAFFNQATGCWLVFYFQHGGSRDDFRKRTQTLTRYKLFVQMRRKNFDYSVFGYGFRKSKIETGSTFDGVALCVEDADNYPSVPEDAYQDALQYFGRRKTIPINEFPV